MRQRQAAAGASWCTFLATHLYLNLRRRSHAHHPLAATGATRIRAYSRRESESGGGDTLLLFVLVATSFSFSRSPAHLLHRSSRVPLLFSPFPALLRRYTDITLSRCRWVSRARRFLHRDASGEPSAPRSLLYVSELTMSRLSRRRARARSPPLPPVVYPRRGHRTASSPCYSRGRRQGRRAPTRRSQNGFAILSLRALYRRRSTPPIFPIFRVPSLSLPSRLQPPGHYYCLLVRSVGR